MWTRQRFPTCPESPPSLKATKLWGSGDSYIGYGGENQSIVGGLLQLKGFTPQFTGTADTYMKDMIPYLNPVGSVFAWDEPVFKKEDQHLALDMNGTCGKWSALKETKSNTTGRMNNEGEHVWAMIASLTLSFSWLSMLSSIWPNYAICLPRNTNLSLPIKKRMDSFEGLHT